jgi:hypothetical protein
MTKPKRPKDRPATPFPVMADTLHRQGDWLWISLRDEWRNVANKPEEIVRQPPSLAIACVALFAATEVQAIDAEYRRLLERSGCTQVTETQGCDINKTKAQNAKAGFGPAAPAKSSASKGTKVAEQACLAKVAKTVGKPVGTLSVIEVLTGEAGIGVTIKVPGATAPWFCLSDAQGHVDNVSFTGKDGD